MLISSGLDYFDFEEYISIVRDGYLDSYPDICFGNVIESRFEDSDWDAFENNDIVYVNLTGIFHYAGKKIHVFIQFIIDVDDKSFEMKLIEFNAVKQDSIHYSALIYLLMEHFNVDEDDEDEQAIAFAKFTALPEFANIPIGFILDSYLEESYWEVSSDDRNNFFIYVQGNYTYKVEAQEEYDTEEEITESITIEFYYHVMRGTVSFNDCIINGISESVAVYDKFINDAIAHVKKDYS